MNIRVIVCDRQKAFLDTVRALLQAHDDIDLVAAIENSNQLAERAQEWKPDVVVLNVGWTLKSDMTFLRMFIRENPSVKVLAVGMETNKLVMAYVLEAGVASYILKDYVFEALVPAIRAAAKGRNRHHVYSQNAHSE